MYGLRALSAAARSLPMSHPQARAVELVLRACWSGQPCTTSRAFSAKADDGSPGQGSKSGNARDWRTWIEQQLSGSDQADVTEEQKAAQQQLSQQTEQHSQEAAPQSAQAEAKEEVSNQKVEEQLESQASSPAGEAAPEQSDTEAGTTEHILSQPSPTQQEHSAAPHEPETSEGGFTSAIDVAPPAHAPSQISDLSADEKVEILLQAIRNRSWEQADSQQAKFSGSEDDSMQLPASGYSEIGALSEGPFQGQMLNPSRTFYPGQSYHPEDLIEEASLAANRAAAKVQAAPKPPRNAEVLQQADFRNLDFLNKFVSEGGQIVSRRRTNLQAKVHRHVARQIKTARVMALLPHTGRAPQFMSNKEYDLQDDDFDLDGEQDEATAVSASLAERKAGIKGQSVSQRQSA